MTFSPDLIFSLSNKLALAAWFALMFAPRRWQWLLVATGFVIPAVFAILYAGLVLPNFGQTDGGFGSIDQVRALFANDAVLTAGWLHYLAFDLAIGTYIAKRSDELGIVRIVQIPILLLTFMFGPIGFVLFLVTSTLWRQWQSMRGATSP